MTPVTATLTRTRQISPPATLPEVAGSEVLATVSGLVVDLDPSDHAWREAGPALTAIVDAVRRSAGGAPSPIGSVDDVAPILRLRDLAHAAHRVAAAPGATVAADSIADHLVALVDAVNR